MRLLLSFFVVMLSALAEAQPLTFRQLTVKDGLPNNGVIALGEDSKGRVWVATFEGLGYLDDGCYVALPAGQLPDIRVDRIHCDEHGTMWVQCYDHHRQVSRYDEAGRCFTTYEVSQLSDSVKALAVCPLIRTFRDPRSSRSWTLAKHTLWQEDTLHADSRFAYTGQTAAKSGLSDEALYTLLLDSRGVLWAGSASGGLFFAYTRQRSYRRLVCLPNALARAVCTDQQGQLWLGIGFDGLKRVAPRDNHYREIFYPMTDTIEGRRVRELYEDSRGALWMGTHDGLYVKPASADAFQRVPGHAKEIYALHQDDQQLWIGAVDGLYRLPVDSAGQPPQLVDSTIIMAYNMATYQHRLWIGAESGLFCIVGGKTTRCSDAVVKEMAVDATGQVWVGTVTGLCRYTPEGLQPVATAADGHAVKGLLARRDFLWCSYDQGICCVNIYTGRSTLLRTEYNEYNSFATFADDRTGRLYFCGTQGIDCFMADSLDSQLRTAPKELWLSENRTELTSIDEQDDTEGHGSSWGFILLIAAVVAAAGCAAAGVFYRKRRAAEKTEAAAIDTAAAAASTAEEVAPLATEAEAATPDVPAFVSTLPEPVRLRFIEQATALVNERMGDADWTAEQMAQDMAMSRSKLFTMMKDATGKGVMEFVRDMRLDFAAQQLKDGVPVSEIAYRCGFSEASSFRRSFAKKFGVNPSQYRKSLNG